MTEEEALAAMKAAQLTNESVKLKAEKLGAKPSPTGVQEILNEIAEIEDDTKRNNLFLIARQYLKDEALKELCDNAATAARQAWQERRARGGYSNAGEEKGKQAEAESERETLDKKVARFSTTTSTAELTDVLKGYAKLGMTDTERDEVLEAIVEKTKRKLGSLKKDYGTFAKQNKGHIDGGGLTETPDGFEFTYNFLYDFVVAKRSTAKVITILNGRAKHAAELAGGPPTNSGMPIISLMKRQPMRLFNEGKKYTLEPTTESQLWAYVNDHLSFVKKTEKYVFPRDNVPENIIKQLFHEGAKSVLPQSPQICTTPVFRADGGLILTEKYHYDDKVGLNHLLSFEGFEQIVIPKVVTFEEAKGAADFLRIELFSDFPFSDTGEDGKTEGRETGEADAFAMILAPFMRFMCPGRMPIFFVTKPKPGTGATLLGGLPGLILEGKQPDILHYTDDDDEMQKRVLAMALSGSPFIFMDDIKNLNSNAILRYTTSPTVGGRRLGGLTNVSLPNNYMWGATGNNVPVDEQMDRRILWMRLNAKMPNPTERNFRHSGKPILDADGFQAYDEHGNPLSHDTLETFIIKNRGTIIRNIVLMIEYWVQQGMPQFSPKKACNYIDWAKNVGGVLSVLRIKGFMCGKDAIETSREMVNDQAFAEAWFVKYHTEAASRNDLCTLAIDRYLDIAAGRFPEDKKASVERALIRLNGNTFDILVGGLKRRYTIYTATAKDGSGYMLKEEEKKGEGESK